MIHEGVKVKLRTKVSGSRCSSRVGDGTHLESLGHCELVNTRMQNAEYRATSQAILDLPIAWFSATCTPSRPTNRAAVLGIMTSKLARIRPFRPLP